MEILTTVCYMPREWWQTVIRIEAQPETGGRRRASSPASMSMSTTSYKDSQHQVWLAVVAATDHITHTVDIASTFSMPSHESAHRR